MLKRLMIADGWNSCTCFVIIVLLIIKILTVKEMPGAEVTDKMLSSLIFSFVQLTSGFFLDSLPLLRLYHPVKLSLSLSMTLLYQ